MSLCPSDPFARDWATADAGLKACNVPTADGDAQSLVGSAADDNVARSGSSL
jgi:hypothetical protein